MTNEEMAKLAKLLVKWLKWQMFYGGTPKCHFHDVCRTLIRKCAEYDKEKFVSDASSIPF